MTNPSSPSGADPQNRNEIFNKTARDEDGFPLDITQTFSISFDDEGSAAEADQARNVPKEDENEEQVDNRNRRRKHVLFAVFCSIFVLIPAIGLSIGLAMRNANNEEIYVESANIDVASEDTTQFTKNDTWLEWNSTENENLHSPLQISLNSTSFPSKNPINAPTAFPTTNPSIEPSSKSPTFAPDLKQSVEPTISPSKNPTKSLSKAPTQFPTSHPTTFPSIPPSTSSPTKSPAASFVLGDLSIRNYDLDIEMSKGLSVKVIAQEGETVKYSNGDESSRRFHSDVDFAGIIPLSGGNYAYVSNSEESDRGGGVYAIYFAENGDVLEYKSLLTGTSKNCGGGVTPWNTWISCEEVDGGQCWQVDPDQSSENHSRPRATVLGGRDGGKFESVACDNTDPQQPIFFVTEDTEFGAVRRYEANGNGWDSLHNNDGKMSYLRIVDESHFEWTTSESIGRESAKRHFTYSEGIQYHDRKLYITAKKNREFLILDLHEMTYVKETTGSKFVGKGSFRNEPDQILVGRENDIYFCQDGGNAPGVHARDMDDGTYRTMFRGIPFGRYDGDETVGIALNPDGTKMYAGFQDAGIILEFTRDDGQPF